MPFSKVSAVTAVELGVSHSRRIFQNSRDCLLHLTSVAMTVQISGTSHSQLLVRERFSPSTVSPSLQPVALVVPTQA